MKQFTKDRISSILYKLFRTCNLHSSCIQTMVLSNKHVSPMISCYQLIGESEHYVKTTNCNTLPHVYVYIYIHILKYIYSCVLSTPTEEYSCLSMCVSGKCACEESMFVRLSVYMIAKK